VLHTATDRFLHLLIDEVECVRFCAHKRNNCADEHGDGDHIESIVHDEKGRQGVQFYAKEEKPREKRKRCVSKAR
jgi:hypothetical protein